MKRRRKSSQTRNSYESNLKQFSKVRRRIYDGDISLDCSAWGDLPYSR